MVLRPEGLLDSHAYGWDFFSSAGITVVNLPTAYWNELIAARQHNQVNQYGRDHRALIQKVMVMES